MSRKLFFALVACFAIFAASCSAGGGSDDADGGTTTTAEEGDDTTTTTEEDGGDDNTTTTEGGDDTTTTEGGGGGGGGSRQAYVDAMAQSLLADDDSIQVTEQQANCLAETWVDIFDPARLEAAGISPADMANDDDDDFDVVELDLSDSEANALMDGFGDCGIDLTKAFVDSIAEEQPLSAEDRACLEDAFDEDFLRRIFVITLTQGDEALEEDPQLMGEMMGALFACPGAMGLTDPNT